MWKRAVMKKENMPIWENVCGHLALGLVRLHVPGHRGGAGLPRELASFFGELAHFDLTELPGLDDLHNPSGAIALAQQLAADLWQADQGFFLVNGSTSGVQAMILATCGPEDIVLVARNAHASVYSGLALSGATPVYLPVETNSDGFPLNVSPEALNNAMCAYPEAKAVIITSPSYYGVCADVATIKKQLGVSGMLLLLDEAHGAHFGFHEGLPVAQGIFADLSVQSWHKTLSSLTPGAVLFLRGKKVDLFRLQQALRVVQTSSPSYPLLCSLDATRQQMAISGHDIFNKSLAAARLLRGALRPQWPLLERKEVRRCGFDLDITRVTMLTARLGLNGMEAARQLSVAGVAPELAAMDHILAVVGPGFTRDETIRSVYALKKMEGSVCGSVHHVPELPPPEVVITPRQAMQRSAFQVGYSKAVGYIASEIIAAFPPVYRLLLRVSVLQKRYVIISGKVWPRAQ
jgi:arginine decarboxylase